MLVLLLLVVGCAQHKTLPVAQATPRPSVLSASSYPNLETQTTQFTDAFFRKDYDRYADLTYPGMVEAAGGKEKFVKSTDKDIKQVEAKGLKYLSYRAGTPIQLVEDSGKLYAVVPVFHVIKDTDGTFRTYGSMIGVSSDNGQNWTFLNVGAAGRNALQIILGNVANKFELPPDRKPEKLTDKN